MHSREILLFRRSRSSYFLEIQTCISKRCCRCFHLQYDHCELPKFSLHWLMIFPYPTAWPQYITASMRNWLPLLLEDKLKNIVTDSLRFMVANKRIELNAFVVMNNHIHLIWQPLAGHSLSSIQLSFMKFTAQQIKINLAADRPALLEQCKVNKTDREYQIWKRNPLSIELSSEKVFLQKLEYIHYNPVKLNLCSVPEDYHYSSAIFYEKGIDHFHMLTHYMGK